MSIDRAARLEHTWAVELDVNMQLKTAGASRQDLRDAHRRVMIAWTRWQTFLVHGIPEILGEGAEQGGRRTPDRPRK